MHRIWQQLPEKNRELLKKVAVMMESIAAAVPYCLEISPEDNYALAQCYCLHQH